MSVDLSYKLARPEHLRLPFSTDCEIKALDTKIYELEEKVKRQRSAVIILTFLSFASAYVLKRTYQWSLFTSFGVGFVGTILAHLPQLLVKGQIKEKLNIFDNFMKAARKASNFANKAIYEKIKDEKFSSSQGAQNTTNRFFEGYFCKPENKEDLYANAPELKRKWRNAIVENKLSIETFCAIGNLDLKSTSFETVLKKAQGFAYILQQTQFITYDRAKGAGFIRLCQPQPPEKCYVYFKLVNWEEAAKELLARRQELSHL